MRIFNKPLLRILLLFLTVFYSAFFLFNPELLQIYLHEHTYHSAGFEIEHKHADYSIHAVFKHFLNESQTVSIKKPKKILFINLFLFDSKFVCVKLFFILFCSYLFIKTLLIQKNYIQHLANPCSRSPPAF